MQKNKAELKKRHIDDLFLQSLKYGELKGLMDLIRRDKTLQLCFRGSYISVYYRGDSLFKIQQGSNNRYKIYFNFNHARYTKNFKEQLEKLEKLKYVYKVSGDDEKKQRRSVTCLCSTKLCSYRFWDDSSKIFKLLIDDFIDPSAEKRHDYFNKKDLKNKNPHLERQRQQAIMRVNNSLSKTTYFVYDMEYDQPRNSSEEVKSGRFDMLALRRINPEYYNLVFIELKSTKAACCNKKSNISKHYEDLIKYVNNKDLIEVRKDDAIQICKQYIELELVEKRSIRIKGVEILFVFTDEASQYAKEIKKDKEKCILDENSLILNKHYN
jgi:hypothetical protein